MEIWTTRTSVDADLLVTVIDYCLEHRPGTTHGRRRPEPEAIATPEPAAASEIECLAV